MNTSATEKLLAEVLAVWQVIAVSCVPPTRHDGNECYRLIEFVEISV